MSIVRYYKYLAGNLGSQPPVNLKKTDLRSKDRPAMVRGSLIPGNRRIQLYPGHQNRPFFDIRHKLILFCRRFRVDSVQSVTGIYELILLHLTLKDIFKNRIDKQSHFLGIKFVREWQKSDSNR